MRGGGADMTRPTAQRDQERQSRRRRMRMASWSDVSLAAPAFAAAVRAILMPTSTRPWPLCARTDRRESAGPKSTSSTGSCGWARCGSPARRSTCSATPASPYTARLPTTARRGGAMPRSPAESRRSSTRSGSGPCRRRAVARATRAIPPLPRRGDRGGARPGRRPPGPPGGRILARRARAATSREEIDNSRRRMTWRECNEPRFRSSWSTSGR